MSKIFEEYKQLCEELNEFEATKIPLCAAETFLSMHIIYIISIYSGIRINACRIRN